MLISQQPMLECSASSLVGVMHKIAPTRPMDFGKDIELSLKKIFETWMADHEKMIRHIIMGFEAKPALQDELFQEIALNVWRALPSFKGNASVKTFIARIAHNILATHVSKAVKAVKTDDDIEQHQFSCEKSTPYQALDQRQRQQRLLAAIQKLSLEQRQVITLALEGMSYQEIADILGINTNLVGVRLNRAKQALMTLLEEK